MKIWTSYFGLCKKLSKKHPDMLLVSIAGRTPEWLFALENAAVFRDLAPKYSWWSEWHEKFKDDYESQESRDFYVSRYQADVLSRLSPSEVVERLTDLAYKHNCTDVCLLCYEKPSEFCHRHLAADWLRSNNIATDEISTEAL